MESDQQKLVQLAEAHVLNIQREIKKLEVNKQEVDAQIENLTEYMKDAVELITRVKTETTTSVTPELKF